MEDWKTGVNASFELHASSLTLGELDHVNKMPFSGILAYFNRPSDKAPNFLNNHPLKGRRVMIPEDVGTAALPSLIGMGVNMVLDRAAHDAQKKIGVITNATTLPPEEDGGVPVYIEGFIYAFDFEDEALQVKLGQSALGFSYETAETLLADGEWNGTPVAVVTDLGYFTGACILYKSAAAYGHMTSLAASAEGDLNVEEVMNAIAALREYIDERLNSFAKLDRVIDKADDEAGESVQAATDGNQEPAEPTEPTEPVVEPAEPTEPVEPQEPAEPSEPETPVEPAEPVEPTEPTEPSEPSEPAEPTEPSEPVEPSVPTDPSTEIQAGVDVAQLQADLQAAQARIAALEEERTSIQAHGRKSKPYATTLLAKYELENKTSLQAAIESIDARSDLSIEERMQMKIEARAKFANKQ